MADETRTLAWQLVIETKGIEANTAKASSALGDLAKGFNFLKTTIAGIAAGALAKSFQDLSDTLTRAQNDIRKVTSSTAEFAAVQNALMVSARGSYTSLETVASNYRALKTSLEGYAVSARQVITIQDTVTKAVKLTGGSAEDAEGVIKKLAFAFETGTVGIRELNLMIREAPDLFKAMGAQIDGGIPKLRQLAKDGRLTGQDLLDGLGGAADKINQQFANRIPTISEAFGTLKTSLVSVFAEFDKATGVSALLSKAILALADDIADLPNQLKNIALNVQEMYQLAVVNVIEFFQTSYNTVKEWIGKIGGFLASAIPDFVPGAAAAKKFFTDLAQTSAETNERIRLHADLSRASIQDNFSRLREEIGKPPDTGMLDEITVVGERLKDVGASTNEFEKALASLRAEQNKVRDQAAALAIEISNGVQASKEYTIAAEARRRIDEQIAGMKGISPEQANQLRALSAATAAAAVELSRYQDAWNTLKPIIEAGATDHEKAAEKVRQAEAAFALLGKTGRLTAEDIRRYNVEIARLREQADPVVQAQKQIATIMQQSQDEADKLAIKNQALSISLTAGDAAARAYINSAEAELAARIKIREELVKDPNLSGEVQKAYLDSAQAIAAAKTANDAYAESHRQVTEAVNFGISSYDQMQQKLEAMRDTLAAGLVPPEQVDAFKAGMDRMAASVDPVKNAFADAAKSMGQAIVNFAIDGAQSFGEFAASVIKDIGRIIAQMLMMQAIKSAFGGTSWGSLLGVAKGGVFDRGNVVPFQHGGVIDGPAMFPLARGAHGLMGEAGPEAVMPLARLPGGDLGVKSQPLNLEVINQTGVNATARVRQDADRTQLILEAAELGATWAQSRFSSSVSSGYGAAATTMQRTYGLTRRKA